VEIREFAERVLFASSLSEKLDPRGALTDFNPGPAIATPSLPGRPSFLIPKKGGERMRFPGRSGAMTEEKRGIILHFFANHELLACELMALVLLKFPDAPAPFRRDVLHTLRQEQEHTRWYLTRMKECGLRFGDIPVNRFFWDAIASMESPLDYVARLNLTFEQANLDYARHYSGVMRNAGDPTTAEILGRIYQDEIGHVGYGLKWLRRWKDQNESEWEAYRKQLSFPLSPVRGKGNAPFNEEGRRKAGLPDEFIRNMQIFEQSRGRTPHVFWFNPGAEAAIAAEAAGIPYQPRAALRQLALDLEILPAFLSRTDDVVLMQDPPSLEERQRLNQLGFKLAEFVAIEPAGGESSTGIEALKQRRIGGLRPWACSPDSATLLDPLIPQLPAKQQRPVWNPHHRILFSKGWGAAMFKELCETITAPWLDPSIAGRSCQDVTEVETHVRHLRQNGTGAIVLKAPYASAGGGNRRLLPGEDWEQAIKSWASRILRSQGSLIVEPWLDRVRDFSIQYEMTAEGLRKVAAIHLRNDSRGQFKACQCGPKFCQPLPREHAQFLNAGGANSPLSVFDEALREILERNLRALSYLGPIGVDACIYRHEDGVLKLKPVVEINPRYTMGRLTWELMRRVAPGHSVRFELIGLPSIRATGFDTLQACAASLPRSILNQDGLPSSGSIVLNDATKARRTLAILTIARSMPC
jgi:uncharacterized ferritin-like protein (DUF455 family)